MNGKAARGWGRRLDLKPLAAFLLITKFTHSVKVYAKLSVVHAIDDVKKQKKTHHRFLSETVQSLLHINS